MKQYKKPGLDIVVFDTGDIITESAIATKAVENIQQQMADAGVKNVTVADWNKME